MWLIKQPLSTGTRCQKPREPKLRRQTGVMSTLLRLDSECPQLRGHESNQNYVSEDWNSKSGLQVDLGLIIASCVGVLQSNYGTEDRPSFSTTIILAAFMAAESVSEVGYASHAILSWESSRTIRTCSGQWPSISHIDPTRLVVRGGLPWSYRPARPLRTPVTS